MLEFHPMKQESASPERLVRLLQAAKAVLLERGIPSMDQYGDMLQWGVGKKDGAWHKVHIYHPDWCSFDDKYRGTIHFHGGAIRGTVLLGHMEHYTYQAQPHPAGDRFYAGQAYRLTRHTHQQPAGTTYELPAMVPHWLKPTKLTLTYFEEQDAGVVSDLVNPASEELDDHKWTQEQADALLPELLALIDAKLESLALRA